MMITVKKGITKIGRERYALLKVDLLTDEQVIDCKLNGQGDAIPLGDGLACGQPVRIRLAGRNVYRTLRKEVV